MCSCPQMETTTGSEEAASSLFRRMSPLVRLPDWQTVSLDVTLGLDIHDSAARLDIMVGDTPMVQHGQLRVLTWQGAGDMRLCSRRSDDSTRSRLGGIRESKKHACRKRKDFARNRVKTLPVLLAWTRSSQHGQGRVREGSSWDAKPSGRAWCGVRY